MLCFCNDKFNCGVSNFPGLRGGSWESKESFSRGEEGISDGRILTFEVGI